MKVFITGTFRSGSTLLTHMMNANSGISVIYDAVHFMRFGYQKYGKDKILLKDAYRLGEDFNKRLTERFKRGFDLDKYREQVDKLQHISYSDLYDIIMQLYLGNTNWGEKTVLEWRNGDDILELFDDMYIIHIVRDPRAVITSWKKTTIAPGNDYMDALGNCFDSMQYGILNKEKHPGRYYVLRYEDLLSNPEKYLTEICELVGLQYEKEMLNTEQYLNKVTRETWDPNTSSKEKLEGISTTPIDKWKEKIDEEDLILCELTSKKLMQYYGYELSGPDLNIKNVYQAVSKLQQSPLAFNGVLNIIQNGQGVQRNPLNHFDPSTWVTDPNKL